ncbi:MAG TPA: PqqD family protein [Acidimicrobiia bacterium]|nr:PqqD family protein [Acidimicrobiia bacterium]
MSDRLPDVKATAVLGPAVGVAWVAIGDEVVVYRVDGAASLVLNSTAGLLWQCLDGTSQLAEILDDIAVTFGANRAEVEKDCVTMVSTWLVENLVQEVTGG